MKVNPKKDKRGFALAVVLVLLAAMALMATGGLLTSRLDRASARNISHHTQARLAALDGIEAAKLRLLEALNYVPIIPAGEEFKPYAFHYITTEYTANDSQLGFHSSDEKNHFRLYPLRREMSEFYLDANNKDIYFELRSTPNELDETENTKMSIQGDEKYLRKVRVTNLENEINNKTVSRHGFWIQCDSSRLSYNLHGVEKRGEVTVNNVNIPLVTRINASDSLPYILQLPSPPTVPLRENILSAATMNIAYKQDLLLPEGFNSNNQSGPHIYSFNSSSLPLNPVGGPRLNLKRLKDYIDNIDKKILGSKNDFAKVNQNVGNLKSKLVDYLVLGNTVAENQWGGGNLSFLVPPTGDYTILEAKQIAANLIDFLDNDLVPTTDNAELPNYFGVEGRIESNGKFRGHPYIISVGTGNVFNRNGTTKKLNSTRVLATLSIINPWSESTLPFGTSYTIDLAIDTKKETIGSITYNLVSNWEPKNKYATGDDASAYFRSQIGDDDIGPNNSLTTYPATTIPSGKGFVFPRPMSSAASYSNGFSMWNHVPSIPDLRHPVGFRIDNMRHKIRTGRIYYYDFVTATKFVVQNIDGLITYPYQNQPSSSDPPQFTFINTTAGPNSLLHRLDTDNPSDKTRRRRDRYVRTDPRLNFKKSDDVWALSVGKEGSPTNLPSNPDNPWMIHDLNVKSDPIGSMSNDNLWWNGTGVTEHFRVYSYGKIADVNTNGIMGFLWSGKPWKTLRMYNENQTPGKEEWRYLGYVTSSSFAHTPMNNIFLNDKNNPNTSSVYKSLGQININTRDRRALIALISSIEGMSLNTSQIENAVDKILAYEYDPITSSFPLFKNYSEFFEVFDKDIVTPAPITDFQKEHIIRSISDSITHNSTSFTIFSTGESLTNGIVSGKAAAIANVVVNFNTATQKYTIKVTNVNFL